MRAMCIFLLSAILASVTTTSNDPKDKKADSGDDPHIPPPGWSLNPGWGSIWEGRMKKIATASPSAPSPLISCLKHGAILVYMDQIKICQWLDHQGTTRKLGRWDMRIPHSTQYTVYRLHSRTMEATTKRHETTKWPSMRSTMKPHYLTKSHLQYHHHCLCWINRHSQECQNTVPQRRTKGKRRQLQRRCNSMMKQGNVIEPKELVKR